MNLKNVALIFFCTTNIFGFSLSPKLKNISRDISELIIKCKFQQAINYSDSLLESDTTEPLYPFLKLCVLGMRDLDFDRVVDSAAFLSVYNRTIKTIGEYEKRKGKTSYSQTLTGYSYVAYASYYLIHKRPFSAIGKGFDALDILKELVKTDSTNYDAQFLLGFYDYSKAELKKRLWMVLFWYPGNKKLGIKRLENSGSKGQITFMAAKISLIDVYTRESEFRKSKSLADSLVSLYPKSRFLMWSRAKYFEALKQFSNAAKIYGELSDLYRGEEYGDYNMLVTRLKQIELLKKMGQKSQAGRIAEEVITCKECVASKENKRICRDIKRYIE